MTSQQIMLSIRGLVEAQNGIDIDSAFSLIDAMPFETLYSSFDHLRKYKYDISRFYNAEKPKKTCVKVGDKKQEISRLKAQSKSRIRIAHSHTRLHQPCLGLAWPMLYLCNTEMKGIMHLYTYYENSGIGVANHGLTLTLSTKVTLIMVLYIEITVSPSTKVCENNFTQNVLIKKYTEFINSTFEELQLQPPNKNDLGIYLSMLMNEQVIKDDLRYMFKENIEFINSTFEELHLQPPNKESLGRYFSMLTNEQRTRSEARKIFRENIEFINSTFEELLLRSPDKEGLERYPVMLRNEKITRDDLRKIILETEEAKNIQSFSHYSAQYWNELDEVVRYLNKLSTGDEKINWIQDMFERFKQKLPFKEVLIVGCGNGWLERALYDLGVGLHFDAFDISEKYLEEAKKQRGNRPIDYFVSDINSMENIENSKYDVIFNYAILHHAENIDGALRKLSHALKPNGLMFNWEYVGPSQNQYSEEHVKIMKEIMSKIPERFRSKHALRPPIENFRVEPTEAIHSDLIRPIFGQFFDIIYERNLNGGIAYQILWNNIDEFRKNDKESVDTLELLLRKDQEYTELRKVPVLFWYGVGTPKRES